MLNLQILQNKHYKTMVNIIKFLIMLVNRNIFKAIRSSNKTTLQSLWYIQNLEQNFFNDLFDILNLIIIKILLFL